MRMWRMLRKIATMLDSNSFQAAIFDMDGLLVDTEPLWRRAEIKVFGRVGVELTEGMTHQTTGLRVDEVVQHWFARLPWTGESREEIADGILEEVTHLIAKEGVLLPGVTDCLEQMRVAGLKIGLASSSPLKLIEAVVEKFGLGAWFGVVESAEKEPFGKPHPAVFLNAARRLEVHPARCLVFEDSVNGLIAAKAARMTCVVVPAAEQFTDVRFGLADLKLRSLQEFRWA